jgi:hypothetical protein
MDLLSWSHQIRTFMSLLILGVGFIFVVGAYADPPRGIQGNVTVTNTPTVNVSTEYRFAGYSTGTTLGNAGSVIGMHALCQADYGEHARMCTSKEWWTSPNVSLPPNGPAWIQPVTVAAYSGLDHTMTQTRNVVIDWTGHRKNVQRNTDARPPTCRQWTDNNEDGLVVQAGFTTVQTRACGSNNYVTCCTPANR